MKSDSQGTTIYKTKTKHIEIQCESCGSIIPSENININKSLGKCPSCNAIYSIEDAFFNNRRGRPEMIIPEGTELLTLPSSLDIQLDWYKSSPKGVIGFLAFFSLFWNGFLLFFINGIGFVPWVMIFHILAGVVMIYWLFSIFLNKTDIIVTSQYLEIYRGPLKNPFKSNISIQTQNIDQLYVEKYVSSTTNNVPNYAYALYAILTNGKKQKLLKGMNKETQLYLEQEIERFLDIKDSAVSNEILT